jgi:adenosine/AMP kinase
MNIIKTVGDLQKALKPFNPETRISLSMVSKAKADMFVQGKATPDKTLDLVILTNPGVLNKGSVVTLVGVEQ